MKNDQLIRAVRDQYAAVSKNAGSQDASVLDAVAQAFGYSADELGSLPPTANLGLSCGNPVALAALREGEVVVDLGCGAGIDVLLAAKRVGPSGKAIGIDMTPEMLQRARANAARTGAANVEFHLATIDVLPLPDSSVDCVLSNCVINLAPEKGKVFREIMRVLKPGGRIAISDIALRQPLPADIAESVEAHVGCIAGALLISDYERLLKSAGFASVLVQETGADLNVYAQAGSGGCCSSTGSSCCDTAGAATEPSGLHEAIAEVLRSFDANAYAASVRVHAVKDRLVAQATASQENETRSTVQVFDKPMCCSTGICGPEVDPALVRFAADLDSLRRQGVQVDRFNLSQQPGVFAQQEDVKALLSSAGISALPVVRVNGRIVSQGVYPTLDDLAAWTQVEAVDAETTDPLAIISSKCC